MKQKILITILFTLSCILQTFAQQKTITGTVTDKSGVGLPGVSVQARDQSPAHKPLTMVLLAYQ
ncbi:MAG: carboxypeptidase-like regulatory domain-containing protein [Chitinophagaceae bacterium]